MTNDKVELKWFPKKKESCAPEKYGYNCCRDDCHQAVIDNLPSIEEMREIINDELSYFQDGRETAERIYTRLIEGRKK